MFSSSDEVYDVSIGWHYILLSATFNFGLGKWAKVDKNDVTLLCVKASLVDWAKFLHSPIFHYAYSLLLKENNSANNKLPLGLFALFSRSFFKRTFSVFFQTCQKSPFLIVFAFCSLVHDFPLARNTRHLFEIIFGYWVR